MLSVLRRIAEIRAKKRQADLVDVDVEFTVSPLRRIFQVSKGHYKLSFRMAFGLLASIVAHISAAVLVVLVPMALVDEDFSRVRTYIFALTDEEEVLPDEIEPTFDLARPDEDPHENVESSLARSQAPIYNANIPLETVNQPNADEAEVEVPEPIQPLEGVKVDEVVVEKGSVGEQIVHVEGAVDRITHEIARHLEKQDVLVVWLMDASLSLVEERQEVAANLDRVFAEIEQLGTVKKNALLHAVVAFGQGCVPMVEPTDDGEKVVEAIRNVANDESGVENTFQSVHYCVNRYKSKVMRQNRKLMIVIWTDESGDDYAVSERTVAACQRLEAPVYAVGPSAMFGKEKGTRPYVHPEDGKTYFLPLNRGPDAVHQEQIQLPFWFEGEQYETLHAGLGPFALTRLARETGGAYFMKDHAKDRNPFALETMIKYVPDYEPVADYVRMVQESPLRTAVMHAVRVTQQRKFKGTPLLEFAPTGDNFVQQMEQAQQLVAYNTPIVEQALAPFGRKGMEDDYQKEKSPRWRAWYDYTLGRLLAMKVRCYEYNMACAEMKGKGREFVDQKSNRWRFASDAELRTSATKRDAKLARDLLTRCVTNNAGTPWAVLAKRELQNSFGFKVNEAYVAPPPPPPARPAPKAVPPKPKPKPIPKPPSNAIRKEMLKKLARPKKPVLPKL